MKIFMMVSTTAILAAVLMFVGCSQTQPSTPAAKKHPSAEGKQYLLAEEPAAAQDVAKAREAAVDDDEVVVVGRIGGSTDPWVEGMAAFTIVDRGLQACSDREGDDCPTPWDYCCETAATMKASSTLVKLVDAAGNPIKTDARELLGVEELQTVVVHGKARRDDAGNLTVLADGIHVQ